MPQRNLPLIGLMLLAGLRRGEVVDVVWGDLFDDHDQTFLRVHGKGAKLRTVKLPNLLAQWIEEWRQISPQTGPRNAMFIDLNHRPKNGQYRPLGAAGIANVVKVVCAIVGLPAASPHDLRRSFSRLAQENGASFELIRQSLGHEHITMTEHYVNSRLKLDQTATDLLDQWLTEGDDDV